MILMMEDIILTEDEKEMIKAYYQEHRATFSFQEWKLLEGHMPTSQLRLVQAWVEIHHDNDADFDPEILYYKGRKID
jgi:hypothetical protein